MFNPSNLPYQLEKNSGVSAGLCNEINPGSSAKDKKGNSSIKINKYYERLKPYYKIKDLNDHTLIFESRYESGNLKRAIKV